jgi:nucleoid DNA-binding protein/cell division protein FtsN
MDMIGSILRELINENSSVEIPGLGTFNTEYASASIQFATRGIAPSSLRIEFSQKPVSGKSNPLKSYLISNIGLTHEKADSILESFCQSVSNALQSDKKAEIKGFGWLVVDIEGGVHFQMYPDFPYRLDSFGLKQIPAETAHFKSKTTPDRETPVIPLHPFDDEFPEVSELNGERKYNFKWAFVAAIFLATLVSFGSVYFLALNSEPSEILANQEKPVRQEAAMVPVNKDNEVLVEKKSEPLDISEKKLETENPVDVSAPAVKSVIEENYYVIAGSFQMSEKSIKLNLSLKSDGFQSEILNKNENGFIRVSAAKFKSKPEAIAFIESKKENLKENLWVLKGK